MFSYASEVIGKNGISAKVVEKTVRDDVEITTFELRYHRFIHGEFMTHRMFSRNASSSRAIPVKKMLEQVINDPAIPVHWGKNKSGMQADEELESGEFFWRNAALGAAEHSDVFSRKGYHKQITNRIIEPFQFIKVVVTSTEWDNFYMLRDHFAAQPEIQELARCMKKAAQEAETNRTSDVCDWHLPYVSPDDITTDIDGAIKSSVARCARVSYMKHDNTEPSFDDDLELYNQLAVRPYTDKNGNVYAEDDPVHLSPLEHQAMLLDDFFHNSNVLTKDMFAIMREIGLTHVDCSGDWWSGNFRNCVQYRQMVNGCM